MYEWLLENREWVFSGIGVSILAYLVAQIAAKRGLASKARNLTNVRSSGNVYIDSKVVFESEQAEDTSSPAPPIGETWAKRIETLRRKNPKLFDKEKGTRFIEEELPKIISTLPKRRRRLKALIFLDIDDLTVINKRYGQNVGDLALSIVAEFVDSREAFDYRGRCGDDTFYGVLFKADGQKALELCEKLRKQVGRFSWSDVAPELRVTCTIGYAILNPDEGPYEWIHRSLHGMLEGKKRGGDIVKVAPEYSGKPWLGRLEPVPLEYSEEQRKARRHERIAMSGRGSGFSLRNYIS